MYWEFILGSAVISAIISGVIGIYTSSRNNKLEYITKERSEWREEIRICAEELWDVSYQKTRKICDRLKVRINAFGKRVSNRYSDDSHIWEVIGEIEKGKCDKQRLHQLQSVLQEYLSLLYSLEAALWPESLSLRLDGLCFISAMDCDYGIITLKYGIGAMWADISASALY